MPQFTVWTNATEEKKLQAQDAKEAAAMYHESVGTMPDNWDGALHVRDEQGEEWRYQRKAA